LIRTGGGDTVEGYTRLQLRHELLIRHPQAFTDYAVPGDRLAISLNSAAKQLAGVNVSSVLGKDKDPVTLAVRFASLPDGVNYPAETLLVAQAKQIQVKITNNGHHK